MGKSRYCWRVGITKAPVCRACDVRVPYWSVWSTCTNCISSVPLAPPLRIANSDFTCVTHLYTHLWWQSYIFRNTKWVSVSSITKRCVRDFDDRNVESLLFSTSPAAGGDTIATLGYTCYRGLHRPQHTTTRSLKAAVNVWHTRTPTKRFVIVSPT